MDQIKIDCERMLRQDLPQVALCLDWTFAPSSKETLNRLAVQIQVTTEAKRDPGPKESATIKAPRVINSLLSCDPHFEQRGERSKATLDQR